MAEHIVERVAKRWIRNAEECSVAVVDTLAQRKATVIRLQSLYLVAGDEPDVSTTKKQGGRTRRIIRINASDQSHEVWRNFSGMEDKKGTVTAVR